jgi:hypothetical protein
VIVCDAGSDDGTLEGICALANADTHNRQ